MRKRLIRGLVAGAAGILVLALSTANAAVSVSIDTADGSTVHSLPGLPADLDYPGELGFNRKVTGKAGFDSLEGDVLYQFIDANGNAGYSGGANLSCNETGSSCVWNFTVAWALAPGAYELRVTASEPNPEDPENPLTSSASIDLTVL